VTDQEMHQSWWLDLAWSGTSTSAVGSNALRLGHQAQAGSGRIVRAATEHRAISDAQARPCNTAEEV